MGQNRSGQVKPGAAVSPAMRMLESNASCSRVMVPTLPAAARTGNPPLVVSY